MENVGIRITVRDDEQALKRLRQIDDIVKRLNKTTVRIRFSQSMPRYSQTLTRLRAMNTVLRQIQQRAGRPVNVRVNTRSMNALRRMDRTIASIRARANTPLSFRVNGTQAVTSLRRIQREVNRTEEEARRSFASFGTNIGGGLLTAGAALRTLSNNVFSNFARNIGATLASTFTSALMEGFDRIQTRIDTMQTAPKMMAAALGIGESKSKKLIEELDQSVRGLPTGLDEITDAWKRYALALGDADKGAKVAIAANNAFLASMSTDTQKYQGLLQLNDILAGKELNSREWNSLIGSMPTGIAEIGRALGYVDTASFQRELRAGNIENEEFIKGLIKAGTETKKYKGRLVEMAEISKQTLSGWRSNFVTAIARGGATIYTTLDKVLQKATGKGVVKTLYEINDAIDRLAEKIAKWIEKNPEKITDWLDRIRNYNWSGVGKGIMSIVKVFEFLARVLARMPGLAAPLSFFTFGGGNMMANATLVVGGIIRAIGRFNEAAEDIKKGEKTFNGLGRLFKAQGRAGKVARSTKGSGAAIQGATRTWSSIGQNLARAFAGAALIFAYGGAIYKLAGWLQKIQNMGLKLNKIQPAIGNITLAVGEMTLLGAVLGALLTAGHGIGRVIETVGLAAISGIGLALAALGKGLNAIGTAKIPSSSKIDAVGAGLSTIFTALQEIGKNPVDSMSAGSYAYIAKSFVDMAKEAQSLRGMKLPDTADIEKLGEKVKAMVDAISDVFGKNGVVNKRFETWNQSKTAKHIDDIWKSFSSTLKTLQNAHKGLTDVSKMKFSKGFGKKVRSNLESLADGIGAIIDFTREMFIAQNEDGSFSSASLQVTPKEMKRYGEIVTNASGIITSLTTLAKQFPTITQAADTLKKTFGTRKNGELKTDAIVSGIKGIAGLLAAMTDPKILGSLQGSTDRLKNLKNLPEITEAIKSIPALVTAVGEAMSATSNAAWLNRRGGDVNNEQFVSRITSIVTLLNSISAEFSNAKPFAGKAKKLRNSLVWLNRAFYWLVEVTKKVNGGGYDVAAIENGVATTIKSLTAALENAGGVAISAALFYRACANIKKGFSELTGKDGTIDAFITALGKIPGALKKVNDAMRGRGAAWKQQLVGGFTGTAQAIQDEINRIPLNLSTANFTQAGLNAGLSFANGFSNGAVASAIQTAALQVIGSVGFSRGGEVQYFARGGSPRRRGNDTISAMLTPGEFVNRRGAVQHFGTRFFERINNLDLDGALASLSQRAFVPGSKVFVDRSQTTNNTNNTKMTFNVQNASQEYTQMKANRWMRALT